MCQSSRSRSAEETALEREHSGAASDRRRSAEDGSNQRSIPPRAGCSRGSVVRRCARLAPPRWHVPNRRVTPPPVAVTVGQVGVEAGRSSCRRSLTSPDRASAEQRGIVAAGTNAKPRCASSGAQLGSSAHGKRRRQPRDRGRWLIAGYRPMISTHKPPMTLDRRRHCSL
jgi:hypothetical protein